MKLLSEVNPEDAATQETALKGLGFKQLEGVSFQCFGSNDIDKVNLFYKQVIPGETFSFGKWVLVLGDDLKISSSNYIKDWANNSGKVDAIDFVPFRKFLIGKNVDALNNRTADVNFDGNVDICDLVTVAKKSK